MLFVTPEYNRSIPGALKNAIDWASRPYGKNSFARKPSAVIGTSPGKIGTAIGQQHLRSILGFCNSPQMNAVEAYIQFEPGLITDDGEVTNDDDGGIPAELHDGVPRVHHEGLYGPAQERVARESLVSTTLMDAKPRSAEDAIPREVPGDRSAPSSNRVRKSPRSRPRKYARD